MTKTYLYRRGDGNEGNFPRALVTLADNDNPYAALKALVASDYIAGMRVRKWIVKHIDVDGEAEYGIHAMVHDGPEGEQAFGAAWLTAELEPLSDADADFYVDQNRFSRGDLKSLLDTSAWRMYRKECAVNVAT